MSERLDGQDHWRRAQDIFESVIELPLGERTEHARRLCGDDIELQETVFELLTADASESSMVVDRDAWAATLDVLGTTQREGQRLGAYRLGGVLGMGGMGEVYAAQRVDGQFERQVAVKLLPAVAGNSAARRFRRERQILAALQHPNIAMLLDGGMTDGRPYLVMERVQGVDITTYCRRHRLSLRQRVRLMLQVADAVAYAHRQGVVHRDLKPQNILVTEDGLCKLLDFGIAQWLANVSMAVRGGEPSGLSQTSQRLSLGYCAPEQLARQPGDVTSDVYSLGVLLYELLADRRPYEDHEASLAALRNAMAENAPSLLDALPHRATSLQQIAGERDASLGQLRRELSGDLQDIVRRALAVQSRQRYGSVDGLKRDLERWLRGLPVEAGTAGWAYRVRKWWLRHPAALLALAALGVTGGFAGWAWHHHRVDEQSRREQEQISEDLLLDVVRWTDPAERLGKPLTPQDVLGRSEAQARDELEDAAQLRILATLAERYRELGELQRAGELAQEVLHRRQRIEGIPAQELAVSLDLLAEVRRLEGRFEDAERLGSQALVHWRRHEQPDAVPLASTLDNLAETFHELGRYEDAEPLYQEALALRRSALGEEHPLVATSLGHYALLLKNWGRPREALDLYEEALGLRRRVLPTGHPDLALGVYQVASMKAFLGRYEEARSDLEDALSLHHELYGDEHPKSLLVQHDLAVLMDDMGHSDAALPILQHVLAARQEVYRQPHPELAQSYTALSALLYRQGDLEGAKRLLEKSFEINRQLFGEDHPYVLHDLLSLAHIEQNLGRLTLAETLQLQALSGFRQVVEPTHHDLCRALVALGATMGALGRRETLEYLEEGAQCYRLAFGDDHPVTRQAQRTLQEWNEKAPSSGTEQGVAEPEEGAVEKRAEGEG